MRHFTLLYVTVILLTAFDSCSSDRVKCENVQEWKVQNCRIVKSKCPDLVLAYYYAYDIYVDEIRKGNEAIQIDSCIFTWQATKERFLRLNVCSNIIHEIKARKNQLDVKSIDSITIFSKDFNQTKTLNEKQIFSFVNDWNNSKTRGYSDNPFDSAFVGFPPYKYKLTVFYGGFQLPFYGYNYLILDSSNWIYEMSNTGELNYFNNYWPK